MPRIEVTQSSSRRSISRIICRVVHCSVAMVMIEDQKSRVIGCHGRCYGYEEMLVLRLLRLLRLLREEALKRSVRR